MHNDDLIAYLQPAPNRADAREWRDVTGAITDIRVEAHRFCLRANLPPGLYRGRIETRSGAFDMQTAMVGMVRVPDGQRVSVGPWDLNHIENHMAMPMARTFVNGRLKGGLWFAMPGPGQIAEGRLCADFGFEAERGETELALEFVERDRARIEWSRMKFMELRADNRAICPLRPLSRRHPRVYVNADELPALRKRLKIDPQFRSIVESLRRHDLDFGADNQGDVDVACLAFLITGDKVIGEKAKQKILELVRMPTWSGRPDPLLMGGDNDRGVGYRLYYTGVAWEFLRDLFTPNERRRVLAKAEEYLRKMYDFTVLQRAYMGHPTTDPHSLGAWNGTGVACMAFYDDLPIARKALPFFHGLFVDSLKMFPPGGKTAWATFFPFHLARYLAAAQTFGGQRPELNNSAFLDNLGRALLGCFETPNTQEMQRGLRTREHRYLTAYLCRFNRTPGIEAIYQTFVEQEHKTAGDVRTGLFDLLYAPSKRVRPAAFPREPLFARDIGDIIAVARGGKTIGLSLSAGLKGGRKASLQVMPHNREFAPSLAAVEISVDGAPVLINITMGTYSLNSALANTMCFDEGGALTNGQYLNGEVGAERSAFLRRCLITGRFIYAHAVLTHALHPRLEVKRAERILVFDRQTGAVVINDSFEGRRPIRFATHLHCSGSATDFGGDRYRLTGGQANLIAGIKGGSKGLGDEEKGELFVTMLNKGKDQRVVIEEASWIPSYIYGLNNTGEERLEDGKFPRYSRWRLEATKPVTSGSFLFALSAEPNAVSIENDRLAFPQSTQAILNGSKPVQTLGCECAAEVILVEELNKRLVLIGAQRLKIRNRTIQFAVPTDMDLTFANGNAQGILFSHSKHSVAQTNGFSVSDWCFDSQNPRSNCNWSAKILSVDQSSLSESRSDRRGDARSLGTRDH